MSALTDSSLLESAVPSPTSSPATFTLVAQKNSAQNKRRWKVLPIGRVGASCSRIDLAQLSLSMKEKQWWQLLHLFSISIKKKEKGHNKGRKETGDRMNAYMLPSLLMHPLLHAQTLLRETNTRKRTRREYSAVCGYFAFSLRLRRFSALFSCATNNQKGELDRLRNFKHTFRQPPGEQHKLSFQGNHNSGDKLPPGHYAFWLCPPTWWYENVSSVTVVE